MTQKLNNLFSKSWFRLLLISLGAMLFVYLYPICSSGNVGFDGSDGMIQYREYIMSIFNQIKTGKINDLNMNMLYGNSIYALEYYVPLDIFTLIMFVLSTFMEFNYAFALVRLLSIFSGILVFYFMSRKVYNFSDKTSFWLSLIWLVSGSLSVYNNYYAYCSLYFYVPLTMMAFNEAHNFKRYVPLGILTFVLMLYNFYLGYMIVAVSAFALVTLNLFNKCYKKENKFKVLLIKELKQLCLDAIPIILGVLCSSFLVIPSLIYILKYSSTSRDSHFYTFLHYIHAFVRNFIPTYEASFKIFQNEDYINCQCSLYITMFGLFSIINLFRKDKEHKKQYLILFSVLISMLIIPFTCYIFTASTLVYSRWYFLFTLIELYLVGKNFENENFELSTFNNKFKIVFLSSLGIVLLLYVTMSWIYKETFYATIFVTTISVVSFVCTSAILFSKNKRKIFFGCEIAFALMIMFSNTLFLNSSHSYVEDEKHYYKIEEQRDESLVRYNVDGLSVSSNIYNANSLTNVISSEGVFFSSFWNNTANPFVSNFISIKSSNSWNFASINNTSIFNSSFLGYKYYVVRKDNKYLIPDYLIYYAETDDCIYYLNTYYNGFGTVYHSFIDTLSPNYLERQYELNNVCWTNSNIVNKTIGKQKSVSKDLNGVFDKIKRIAEAPASSFEVGQVYQFLTTVSKIQIKYKSGEIVNTIDNTIVVTKDMESIIFTMYPNNDKLFYVQSDLEDYNIALNNLKQREGIQVYQNGDTFTCSYNKTKNDKTMIVLPITYSDEFSCKEGYEIVQANGSFIGIVIPENTTGEITITLNYNPSGQNLGYIVSTMFIGISCIAIGLNILYKKRKETLRLF